jgi:hypothetical protein
MSAYQYQQRPQSDNNTSQSPLDHVSLSISRKQTSYRPQSDDNTSQSPLDHVSLSISRKQTSYRPQSDDNTSQSPLDHVSLSISTKQTSTSHLKPLNTKQVHDICLYRNPGPSLGVLIITSYCYFTYGVNYNYSLLLFFVKISNKFSPLGNFLLHIAIKIIQDKHKTCS